jgi:hypothetical protein
MRPAPSRTLSVYKGKAFVRFARKAHITDADLWQAAQRANDGLIDADLGGGVIKQKSGGSRSIILFKKNNRAVYVYGFEKKDAANIDRRELEAFRELAEVILGYTDVEIEQRVNDGVLFNVEEPGEDNAK